MIRHTLVVMLLFLRSFRSLLDQTSKRRLGLAVVGAVAVAIIEALGLLLLVPLVQVITQADSGRVPTWATAWFDNPSPLSVAAALGAVVLGSFIIRGAASLSYLRWNLTFVLAEEAKTSRRLLSAYLHAPYPFHLSNNSSNLQRNVHDNVRRVYQDVVVAFVGAVADLALIVAVAIVLVVVEPVVAISGGLYFIAVGFGYQHLIHGRASAAGQDLQRQVAHAYRVVQESLGSIKDVQISHSQDVFVNELGQIKEQSAQRFRTLLLLNQAPRYYLEISMILGVGLLAWALYPRRSATEATAVLSLFLAAGFRLLPSINRVLVALSAIRAGQPALSEITADLAMLEGSPPAQRDRQPGRRYAEVRFDTVGFAYQDHLEPVVRDLSFVIRPGESVAFVGASGTGKSTTLDLLLGLLTPSEGAITVGGVPLADTREAWHQSIGYVPQEVVLLDASVRSNVAIGVPDADVDEEQLRQCLQTAQLEGPRSALPDGPETMVGERGTRLSGGQRQRIGIARALYRRPTVLVLDEATSSLDARTESAIIKSIHQMHEDLTCIVVTHRLDTLRSCDKIYVLEDGTIRGAGTFDELAESSARFRELWAREGRRDAEP